MKSETAFEQLKRKNPRLAKRIRAVTFFLVFYSSFISFILGTMAPSLAQNAVDSMLTLSRFFVANPLLGMLVGGFALGLNLGTTLTIWRLRR